MRLLLHHVIRGATNAFMKDYQVPEDEEYKIRRKFTTMKSLRDEFRKRADLRKWENMSFNSTHESSPKKIRITEANIIF